MTQKNISKKNIKRLEQLATIEDARFQSLRAFVLQVAMVVPRKRKRWGKLRHRYPNLYSWAVELNLVDDYRDFDTEWSDTDDWYEQNFDQLNLLLHQYALDSERRLAQISGSTL